MGREKEVGGEKVNLMSSFERQRSQSKTHYFSHGFSVLGLKSSKNFPFDKTSEGIRILWVFSEKHNPLTDSQLNLLCDLLRWCCSTINTLQQVRLTFFLKFLN